MTRLYDLIIKSAEKGIKLQEKHGNMPGGNNGPWRFKDTPVRNTSHWLIIFLTAYKLTKRKEFKLAAKKAADYLTSKKARPYNGSFFCCKDHPVPSNGLIGQAWVIEALILASTELKNPSYKKTAIEVFLMHHFNEKLGLWHNTDLKGNPHRDVNKTFNQQLMFATVGKILAKNSNSKIISSRVEIFLKNLEKNLEIYSNGLIFHEIAYRKRGNFFRKPRDYFYYLKKKGFNKKGLSIGYHSFNLYIFSLLRNQAGLTNHKFWNSSKFKKILKYTKSRGYSKKLTKNEFAFSYNPTGFEIAYTLKTFFKHKSCEREAYNLINKQIKLHYSFKENLMSINTSDRNTLSARIYEATRLPNFKISTH